MLIFVVIAMLSLKIIKKCVSCICICILQHICLIHGFTHHSFTCLMNYDGDCLSLCGAACLLIFVVDAGTLVHNNPDLLAFLIW
jgi:hypothetical protein